MPVAIRPPPPPGPGRRPPLDDLRTLQVGPHEFILRVARQYGGLVRYPVGPLAVYLVSEPDSVRHILQENSKAYSKDTFQYNLLRSITGAGLLTSDGDFWLRQRRLAQPAFHRQRIAGLASLITSATEAMLAGWDEHARRGEPVDVAKEMMHVALQIVAKAMFGAEVGDEADALAQATLTVLDHIVGRARTFGLVPQFLPTSGNLRFREAMRVLDGAVYGTIEEHRRSGRDGDDLLSMLIQARDPESGEAMTDRQLRDEVMTMLVAGHETVASAMAWTWHLLDAHREVEETLHAELARVLHQRRIPTATDLPKLRYVEMVFQEAMRLYPPAWIISRKSLADDEIGGCRIPRGALVVTSPYVTHRLESIWDQPDAFRPERFAPQLVAARPRFSYYPFGGGPRLCIGNHFATVEAQLVIATVAQRYVLRAVPGHPVEVEPGVTLRPKHGLLMTLQARKATPALPVAEHVEA